VVYALAPSSRSPNVIWAGSDDGLIHLTLNGGRSWTDVTPKALGPWNKVSVLEASHFDTLAAYAAINTLRTDDLEPYIYRTRDGGKSWNRITTGIPGGATINAVREDPRRKGLLFAGSETQVWVSFDDGDHWQSLRLNLPATSIRDLAIKDDDLLAGTHGRGFWILDNLTPLRALSAATAPEPVLLFKPARATRVRWNLNPDTPLPPDEPTAPNPPDGALFDYWLAQPASGAVTLEILDSRGASVRTFSTTDPPEQPIEGRNIPDYWIRPESRLSGDAGAHRFVWNLRGPQPAVLEFAYPIAAVPYNTPQEPAGIWALPGNYLARLTVNGRSYTQPFSIRMDPRVKAAVPVLTQQHRLGQQIFAALREDKSALDSLTALRTRVHDAGFDRSLAALGDSLARLNGDLATLFGTVQDVDAAPTTQILAAIASKRAELEQALVSWRSLRAKSPIP
jgi:hypothetical protein